MGTLSCDTSDGIRLEWACNVRNVCQVFVGTLMDGDPTRLAERVHRLHESLPTPNNRAESVLLRQSLAMLMHRAARTFDQRFHATFSQRTCDGALPTENEGVWVDPETTIEALLHRWIDDYTAWLHRYHVVPPAIRVGQILRERFFELHTLESLARAVGCSRTTLMVQFRRFFGLSPLEYQARVRVAEGMRLLRTATINGDEVARDVGYQSANKFYARLRRHAQLRASQVRALSDDEFNAVLREVTMVLRM